MSIRGKMMNALRRDCHGCDNRVRAAGWWGPCTCGNTKRERQKEKRALRKELDEYKKSDHSG